MSPVKMSQPQVPVIVEQPKTRVLESTPWMVIVWDDPVNLMGYVTMVLQQIFGYSKGKASKLMMEVHEQGKSVVWSGEKERAELYVQQLQSKQLKSSMESVEA